MNKKSIAVISIAFLMSVVAVIFLFFDKSAQAPKSEISSEIKENVVPSAPEDVLLQSPEDQLPVEDENTVIKGGEGEELRLDTNF